MDPTVILFDVDGTLISSGGAGRRALVRLFEEELQRGDAFDEVSFAGMTDRAILRAGLRAAGRDDGDPEVDRLLAAYPEVLRREVAEAEGYRLHDGVVECLDRLSGLTEVAVGLGTGNVEIGARIKLQRVGIADRFPFGGFGSDHEDRARLLEAGAERGAAHLGRGRADCRVIVIGDTPKDINAARAIGAECIAVATGPFEVTELQDHGPTLAVQDLTAPAAWSCLQGQ